MTSCSVALEDHCMPFQYRTQGSGFVYQLDVFNLQKMVPLDRMLHSKAWPSLPPSFGLHLCVVPLQPVQLVLQLVLQACKQLGSRFGHCQ